MDTHAPPAASNILDLAVASGFTVIRGPTLLRDGVHYGNALLARCPVVEIRRHDLSVAGREPRGAIDARLDVGGVALRVVVTHFGLRRAERRLQVKKLLAALEAGAAEPTTLLGDLNEWLPGSRSLRPLERWFGRQLPAPRTFPAGRPVLALDRIWTRPAGALAAVRAFRGGDARVASDHLPLVAAVARVSLRPAERR